MINTVEARLNQKIFFSMLMGVVGGSFYRFGFSHELLDTYFLNGALAFLGNIFIASLKMIVVPLVFFSLVSGVSGLKSTNQLGRYSFKAILLYGVTTLLAISIAVFIADFFSVGVGFHLPHDVHFEEVQNPSILQVFQDIVPVNPIKAAADGRMLQIIFFAILFGLALSQARTQLLTKFIDECNQIMLKILQILIVFAPVGVFALVFKVFAKLGFDAIYPLLSYFLLVLVLLLLQMFIIYPFLLASLSLISPRKFFQALRPVILFAFSTASSSACIPVTMEALNNKLKLKPSITSFIIPLGATINMDGTAIMQGVATIFIANAYALTLGASQLVSIVVTATLASIGTAGVPGVGLVMLAMVLKQVGLPVEGIALIIGIDRLLDMVRTSVNVCGDATVACIVSSQEESYDEESVSSTS